MELLLLKGMLSAMHYICHLTCSRLSLGGTSPSAFTSLPIEVHHMIFSHLTEYADTFCLSLVDPYFWHIGRQHLKQSIVSLLCPMADKALICVGDYISTKQLNYPVGLLTTDEEEELQAGLDSDDEDEDYWGSCASNGPVNLYQLARARYCKIAEVRKTSFWPEIEFHFRVIGQNLTSLQSMASKNLCVFPKSERSRILALASPEFEQFYPESKKWVLRNLTTREFVRADAIALKPDLVKGPLINGLGFGEVVLSRICWSSDPATSTPYEGPLHRGVWAGHRFDITTIEKLQIQKEEEGADQWKDVSEEVAKEVEAIWKCEFGDDWVSIVCGAA
jgi:hypothetical protein